MVWRCSVRMEREPERKPACHRGGHARGSTGYALAANLVQGERTTASINIPVTGATVFDHGTGLRPGGFDETIASLEEDG